MCFNPNDTNAKCQKLKFLHPATRCSGSRRSRIYTFMLKYLKLQTLQRNKYVYSHSCDLWQLWLRSQNRSFTYLKVRDLIPGSSSLHVIPMKYVWTLNPKFLPMHPSGYECVNVRLKVLSHCDQPHLYSLKSMNCGFGSCLCCWYNNMAYCAFKFTI